MNGNSFAIGGFYEKMNYSERMNAPYENIIKNLN